MITSTPRRSLLIAGWLVVAAAGCDEWPLGDDDDVPVAKLWSVTVDGDAITPLSTPAVSGDAVGFLVDDGVEARAAGSGAALWKDASRGAPRYLSSHDGVFYGAGGSMAFAIRDDGDASWSVPLPYPATGRPSAADDAAFYVPLEVGRLIALATTSGAERWQRQFLDDTAQDAALRGVAIGHGLVYVAVEQFLPDSRRLGYVYALDAATGETVWRYRAPRRSGIRSTVIDAPALSSTLLLASDMLSNSVFALDAVSGDSLWTWQGPTGWTGPRASPVVRDGVAYVGSGDTHVYALSLATGTEIWSRKLDSSVHQVALCGDYLLAHRDQLEVLATDGRRLEVLIGGDDFVRTDVVADEDRAWFATSNRLVGVSCE